jgi:hypothetical protein
MPDVVTVPVLANVSLPVSVASRVPITAGVATVPDAAKVSLPVSVAARLPYGGTVPEPANVSLPLSVAAALPEIPFPGRNSSNCDTV